MNIKVENQTYKRVVFCLECHYDFISRVAHPRCTQCHSLKVVDYTEIPRYKQDKYFEGKIKSLQSRLDDIKIKQDQTSQQVDTIIRILKKVGIVKNK